MKQFFINIWEWIKKTWKIIVRFFKEEVWAAILGILALIIIFVFSVQGIVKAVDKANKQEEHIENMATPIASSDLRKKMEKGDTFVLFIGSSTCGHCAAFHETINEYIISTGKEIFYYETDDETDFGRTKMNEDILTWLTDPELIAEDRGITGLATPTTVYIQEGEFADAIQGAYGMEGGVNYSIFCDVIEGKYVGKPTYTNKLEGSSETTPAQ